jgi:hypothetical protein
MKRAQVLLSLHGLVVPVPVVIYSLFYANNLSRFLVDSVVVASLLQFPLRETQFKNPWQRISQKTDKDSSEQLHHLSSLFLLLFHLKVTIYIIIWSTC